MLNLIKIEHFKFLYFLLLTKSTLRRRKNKNGIFL